VLLQSLSADTPDEKIDAYLSGDQPPTAAALEMRMARLRKKLIAAGAASPGIRALYNRGYMLCSKILIGQ
jgi:DNA-binding response OmpR family regulator